MKKTITHQMVHNKKYSRAKFRETEDGLVNHAYESFGKYTGISKPWFGLFFYMGLTGIFFTALFLITNINQ